MELLSYLNDTSNNGFLSLKDHFKAMEIFTCNFREVEQMALENNLTPLRYKRNQKTISQSEQHTLFKSTVLILFLFLSGDNPHFGRATPILNNLLSQ